MLYLSSLLQSPEYHPAADNLFAALEAHGIKYDLMPNTKDIWIRDFMPVRCKDGKYVSFRYEPSYLKKHPHLRTDFKKDISGQLSQLENKIIYSDINLDGGNVVFSPSKDRVIISDRVYIENPNLEKKDLICNLEKLLGGEIIIISSLISDMTGHADGMVRFVNENTVIGNTSPYRNGLEQRVRAVLNQEGLKVIDFPYYMSPKGSAAGCYLNFLETEEHVLLPVFGSDMDHQAVEMAEQLFPKKIIPIRIDEIAADGGCLNCISWEISVNDS